VLIRERVESVIIPARATWSGGRLLVADPVGAAWLDGKALPMQGKVRAAALSPSGEHALVVREHPRTVLVWSGSAAPVELKETSGVDCLDATFVVRDAETLVAVVYKHEVVLHRPDGSLVTSQALGGFAAASMHPVAGGTALALFGAELGESRDTVIVFAISELPVDGAGMGRRMRFTEGLADSAHLLACGPAGTAEVIVYRDGDDEEPLDEDDAGAIVPREWAFTGFYIATLRGERRQRITATTAAARDAWIAASERHIVVASNHVIDVISRIDSSCERLELQWLSVTATGDRLLAKALDGTLHLLVL